MDRYMNVAFFLHIHDTNKQANLETQKQACFTVLCQLLSEKIYKEIT